MSVFKSYLRQLIRQLKALKKAHDAGDDGLTAVCLLDPFQQVQNILVIFHSQCLLFCMFFITGVSVR